MVSALDTQVCQAILHVVDRATQRPLSPESAAKLRDALDRVHAMVQTAKVVKDVAEQLITLYGQLDTRVMEFEVHQIVKKAQEGDTAAVVKFYQTYAPSLKERLVIELALSGMDLSEEDYLAVLTVVEEGMNSRDYAKHLFKQLPHRLQKALDRFWNEALDFPHDEKGTTHNDPSRDFYDFRGMGA